MLENVNGGGLYRLAGDFLSSLTRVLTDWLAFCLPPKEQEWLAPLISRSEEVSQGRRSVVIHVY